MLHTLCRLQHESTAARTLHPNLHAPQPRHAASDASAEAVWAPQASRLSANVLNGQDEMAKQIRAKFENLVRANPLPKASTSHISLLTELSGAHFKAGCQWTNYIRKRHSIQDHVNACG